MCLQCRHMPTKTRIVKIGNSRGIRVPKVLLDQAQLPDEVELHAEPGRLVVQATRRPRTGWAKAARAMRERAHDALLDEPTPTRFDREEWEWKVTRSVRARGEVHLVRLDPTLGSEIQKTRPCLVVSPDELSQYLRTVIVAPMTTGGRAYPWRVACRFQRRAGFVALDQLRTVDADRPLPGVTAARSGR